MQRRGVIKLENRKYLFTQNTKPRFNEITTLAYEALINQCSRTLPVNGGTFCDLEGNNVLIVSFQKYAELSNCPLEAFLSEADYSEGYVTRHLRKGLNLILYNEEKHKKRQRHTIYHEVGHILLNHKKSGNHEEIEAHFFAAQYLMPDAVIQFVHERRYPVDEGFLMDCFDVSKEAAKKKLNYMEKYGFMSENMYDMRIRLLFMDHLHSRYPKIQEKCTIDEHINDLYGSFENYLTFCRLEERYLDPN